MSQKIKFRAWDKELKMMTKAFSLEDLFEIMDMTTRSRPIICMENGTLVVGFSGLTFLRYSGSKDKNNKEIYEGDIVRCWKKWSHFDTKNSMEMVEGYATAVIRNCGWSFYYEELSSGNSDAWFFDGPEGPEFCPNNDTETQEIIGNIYKNPELLENKK